MFSGKTAQFDTGSIGGWTLSEGELSSDGITLDSANDQILVGSATAPLTGVGVFIGSDGDGGYDFRVGDPSGDYLHWDASESTLTVSGTLDGVDGTFSGDLDAAGGTFSGTLRANEIEITTASGALAATMQLSSGNLTFLNASDFGVAQVTSTGFAIGQRLELLSEVPAVHAGVWEFYGSDADPSSDDPVLTMDNGAFGQAPRIGFLGQVPVSKRTVSGSKSTSTADVLGQVIDALELYGLLTDQTSA